MRNRRWARGMASASIPTLMLFAGGQPVARNAGAMDARRIVAWAREHAPEARSRQTSAS